MGRRLYCGGLSYGTDDARLREACAVFGRVEEVKVITDRETGQSRGFGFVTFAVEADALRAQQKLDGSNLDGRTIRVNEAEDRRSGNRSTRNEERPPRDDQRVAVQGWRRDDPQSGEATSAAPSGASRRREPPPEQAFAEPRDDAPPPLMPTRNKGGEHPPRPLRRREER